MVLLKAYYLVLGWVVRDVTKIKNLGLISVDVFMQNNLQLWKQEFTELKDVNFILLYILVFLAQKLSNKQE